MEPENAKWFGIQNASACEKTIGLVVLIFVQWYDFVFVGSTPQSELSSVSVEASQGMFRQQLSMLLQRQQKRLEFSVNMSVYASFLTPNLNLKIWQFNI